MSLLSFISNPAFWEGAAVVSSAAGAASGIYAATKKTKTPTMPDLPKAEGTEQKSVEEIE